MRSPLALNVTLAVLALAGAGWAFQLVTASSSTPAAAAGTSTGRPVAVSQGTVVSTASATGTVQSANTATADFATSGTITSISVKVGDAVAKGQVLAKVDPTDAQAQLNTANANLAAAKASLTRAQSGGDEATIAAAQAQVTSAKATVDSAYRSVVGTTLTAPIAGTVTAINGSVGGSSGGSSSSSGGGGGGANSGASNSSSSSSTGFIQLADLGTMQVQANFAEADATKLKVGQTATVNWAALTNATASAKVATIAPTATTANNVNSYAVVVSLDTLPPGTRIGQTVTVQVMIAQVDATIRVPSAAVRSAGNRHTVQVSSNGTTTTRSVEVGLVGDTFTQVLSGLDVGEQVVIVTTTTTTNNGGFFPGTGGFGGGGGGFGGGGGGNGGGRG
jgi:macrolide-specific efflux system membrane fusion protein